MTKRIDLQEYTYRRLFAVLDELAQSKTRDMTIDDVINELIDIYQENSWTHFGPELGEDNVGFDIRAGKVGHSRKGASKNSRMKLCCVSTFSSC